jgi:hypothetical protein
VVPPSLKSGGREVPAQKELLKRDLLLTGREKGEGKNRGAFRGERSQEGEASAASGKQHPLLLSFLSQRG